MLSSLNLLIVLKKIISKLLFLDSSSTKTQNKENNNGIANTFCKNSILNDTGTSFIPL
jgi:hypothetical protein